MHINHTMLKKTGFVSILTAVAALALGGCYGSGSPSVAANPQTISFAAAPPLATGRHRNRQRHGQFRPAGPIQQHDAPSLFRRRQHGCRNRISP